jgi:hypothetical protein
MKPRIKYVVVGDPKDQVASIVRHEEDSSTGELLRAERMLTLTARSRVDDQPPSEMVMEDFFGSKSWGFDTTDGDGYTDFDAAYIAARAALGLPIGWAAPDGGTLEQELRTARGFLNSSGKLQIIAKDTGGRSSTARPTSSTRW